jgi:hypothetical protein
MRRKAENHINHALFPTSLNLSVLSKGGKELYPRAMQQQRTNLDGKMTKEISKERRAMRRRQEDKTLHAEKFFTC